MIWITFRELPDLDVKDRIRKGRTGFAALPMERMSAATRRRASDITLRDVRTHCRATRRHLLHGISCIGVAPPGGLAAARFGRTVWCLREGDASAG